MAQLRTRNRVPTLFFSLCALPLLGLFAAAPEGTFSPKTITTQDRQGAVILWDATPYVDRFAQQGTPMRAALKSLEAEAVALFVRNAAALASRQHHLRVVVSYVQSGATEARYQTKTFAGVKTILSVQGNISPRMRFRKGWESEMQRGNVPAGLKVEVARDLPTDNP